MDFLDFAIGSSPPKKRVNTHTKIVEIIWGGGNTNGFYMTNISAGTLRHSGEDALSPSLSQLGGNLANNKRAEANDTMHSKPATKQR